MSTIEAEYGIDKVRRHKWVWVEYKSTKDDQWVPHYKFAPEPSVDDVWTEWTTGLGGHLSVLQLCSKWGTEWRRGDRGLATEQSWRKKLITLIESLSKKPNWTIPLALRYLHERYPISPKSLLPHLRTTRSFITWLQDKKVSRIEEVLHASKSYP